MRPVIFHVLSAVQNKYSVIIKELKKSQQKAETSPALESGHKISRGINKRSMNPVLSMIILLIKALTSF